MLRTSRELVAYENPTTGRKERHHVVIACVEKKKYLLSHINLFLLAKGSGSVQTSARYSDVLSRFYRFLSGEQKFDGIDVAAYHVLADNLDVKRWQVARQVQRVEKQRRFPTSETIFKDAKLVLLFFKWLLDEGYPTNVKVKTKTWIANFRSSQQLGQVRSSARIVVDAKGIEVLDKEARQKRLKSLPTNEEIGWLMEAYSDPVYTELFRFALGTAMRPMDLCAFPYLGNGANRHIMPFSQMRCEWSVNVDYLVESSKGNKSRTIKIQQGDLKALEQNYISIYHAERAAKYERIFGLKCPPSVLFLNAVGRPVTPKMISQRTGAARLRAIAAHPKLREGIDFYSARHWWPTMFLIKFFGHRLLTEHADALYLAAAEVLRNQMGHDDIDTTYRHYVDFARVVLLTHSGRTHELLHDQDESVTGFVARFGNFA